MKKRRGPWTVFGLCVLVVVATTAWITADLLSLERSQNEARAEAAHEEAMRLALWRMDSWLGPALAAETGPTASTQRVVRAVYSISASGQVKPVRGATPETDRIVATIEVAEVRRRLREADERGEMPGGKAPPGGESTVQQSQDFELRSKSNVAAQSANAAWSGLTGEVGPLVPTWLPASSRDPDLFFVRRGPVVSSRNFVRSPELTVYLADWKGIERALLEQVVDILPLARLRPLVGDSRSAETGFVLASAPLALDADPARPASSALLTPSRTTLALAWLALAVSFAAVGVALRRTVELSERRSRFASSVTHELRTPLTTFRLYSEMLADGMVSDPAQRQTYLATLKSESTRLAQLVENVLAYARVEEGRMPLRREEIAVADLLLRVTPSLERRAREAQMELRVDPGDAAAAIVDVDPDVVGQILFNLVDNACKYCSISPEREIEIGVGVHAEAVRVAVRDHGPGIAPSNVRAAFTPFERAGRPAGDAVPGIGLGLVLSRALARDLGGDLHYEPAPGGGACFVLMLPSA